MKSRPTDDCLPILYFFGPGLRPHFASTLKGVGLLDSSRGYKLRSAAARYGISSDGLVLFVNRCNKWINGHKRTILTLLLTVLLAGAVWLGAGLFSFSAVSPHLQFGRSLVFSATIRGKFHRSRIPEDPKFIPRVIHQTYSSLDALPSDLEAIRQSWIRVNPTWEVSFWDDVQCREFVRNEFPEYYSAYVGLPKNVERADFFRYLVVLRHGGVYADIDTECKQPLDDLIRAADTLVVGWEGEVPDAVSLVNRHFARYRQVQQWFFAGAAEHPALRQVCDHIAAHFKDHFHEYTNLDTLDRTGPGAWTDAVLSTASQYPPVGAMWSVRFLPLVATAVYPHKVTTPGLTVETPGIIILHHFHGSWKSSSGYASFNIFSKVRKWLERPQHLQLVPVAPFSTHPTTEHYPVSINHAGTIFTVMVNLIGHGDLQSHEDVSAVLTRFGNWQAGMDNTLSPRAPVALIGALDKVAPDGDKLAFLDVGAGLGVYSLTAAARGHSVIATELAPASLSAFHHSIQQNGFEDLINVQNVTLGEVAEEACVAPLTGDVSSWRKEEVARGYAAPQLHGRTDATSCAHVVRRVVMPDLVPEGVRVGAVRVSAGAWTGDVLKGGVPFLREQQPAAILIEVDMTEMSKIGSNDFLDVIGQLQAIGYRNMGHAGQVCVTRFEAMITAFREETAQGALQTDVNDLRQPAWCELDEGNLVDILEQNRRNGAEKQDLMSATGVELLLLQLNQTAI